MLSGPRRLVLLVWLCFLARGAFHAVLLPLWEGFDEWAHFAYAQQLAEGGGLPVLGRTPVSREVAESLSLTPLPFGHHPIDVPRLTYDAYWKLAQPAREDMRRRLDHLPRGWARQPAAAGPLNHEAQQPPLYYLLMAPVQWAAGEAPLPARVLLMRLATLLATSLVIPLAFAAGRRVLPGEGPAAALAALIAAMPGFTMTACRVGNDGVAAVIFAALLCLMLRERPPAFSCGVLLGAGLLTKAYFLTAIPAMAAVYAWKRRWRGAAAAFLTAGLLSGWWYWRNRTLTGSWSGLQQVAGSDLPVWRVLGHIPQVDWARFFDIAFLSHIWIGNWSFLQLRGWMYRVFALIVLTAAAGLLLRFRRERASRTGVWTLASFYGFFWLGLCYHELTFSVLGLSSAAGWYLYAVVVAETLLAALGLTALSAPGVRQWVLPAGAALFALLDLYATHFLLLPYYTGLIAHRADGALAAFRLSQFGGGGFALVLHRLMAPPAAAGALWIGFVMATLALPPVANRAAGSKLS
ncbi:MAG: hypothetical protein IT159_14630 [Bryobacterales bacterium]|nr:hypothetical protein [Bryobacterales bacterium]